MSGRKEPNPSPESLGLIKPRPRSNKTPAERAVEFLIAELGDSRKWRSHEAGNDFGIQHIKNSTIVWLYHCGTECVQIDGTSRAFLVSKRGAVLARLVSSVRYDCQSRELGSVLHTESLALCAKLGIDVAEGEE